MLYSHCMAFFKRSKKRPAAEHDTGFRERSFKPVEEPKTGFLPDTMTDDTRMLAEMGMTVDQLSPAVPQPETPKLDTLPPPQGQAVDLAPPVDDVSADQENIEEASVAIVVEEPATNDVEAYTLDIIQPVQSSQQAVTPLVEEQQEIKAEEIIPDVEPDVPQPVEVEPVHEQHPVEVVEDSKQETSEVHTEEAVEATVPQDGQALLESLHISSWDQVQTPVPVLCALDAEQCEDLATLLQLAQSHATDEWRAARYERIHVSLAEALRLHMIYLRRD